MSGARGDRGSIVQRGKAGSLARPRAVAGPGLLHWSETKQWLDAAAHHLWRTCRDHDPAEPRIEAELVKLQDSARIAGIALHLTKRDHATLARQIAVWFAHRDPDSAVRLTRAALAMALRPL